MTPWPYDSRQPGNGMAAGKMRMALKLPTGKLKRCVVKEGTEWDGFAVTLRKKAGFEKDAEIVVLDTADGAEIEDVDGPCPPRQTRLAAAT